MKRRIGETGKKSIRHFRNLDVYQNALATGLRVYELTKKFPAEERYALTDQIRRSSRSVCANIAEAWRKRRYKAAFISKLNDAEAEAAETQVWLQVSVQCSYMERETGASLYQTFHEILGTLVGMINHPETWTINRKT